MIFGEKLANRLIGERYQELCLKMTRLSLDVKEKKEAFKRLKDEWNGIKKHIEEEPLDYYRHVKRCKAEQHRANVFTVIRPSAEKMVWRAMWRRNT